LAVSRIARNVIAVALLCWPIVAVRLTAQNPAQTQPPSQTPPVGGGRGQGRGGGRGETFPAQQRPPADPAVLARGKGLFDVTCALCHGADLRGGQLGGVNLLRSQLVLSDQAGELILPVVRAGRPEKGMPPLPMPDEDVKAVVEYIHSVLALSPRQGMPPPAAMEPELNILVGDAAAGETYFHDKCGGCHAVDGDLQGIATRVPDAKALQNLWVSGGSAGGRGGRRGGDGQGSGSTDARAATVTVTLPSGTKFEGRLMRIDDFLVTLVQDDGVVRSFRRDDDVPKVEVHDPLEAHRRLLGLYTDRNMHDVTAYLATLK
jgi:cytochrome c oxidase cbb3-type subunit 3